jgi:aspartate/methionine/tyrosine aminotransferase
MTLAPFALERWFARHEFSARHLLCASDCESMSVEDLLALEPGARERFLALRLGYTESAGSESLRRQICGLYGSIGPEQVLVHNGAEEAIFLFMHAALAPGDHLIVHSPCYQSLAEVARSLGCVVDAWRAREDDGWALDTAELERLARKDTKAIVLNTPHNPTGWHMPAAQLHEVVRFAEQRGIVLFSDEVYRGLEQDPRDMLPAGCDCGSHVVSLGVMSKTWGLAGLRIGWIATKDTSLLSRIAGLKDYTTICASAPGEFLAETALRHREAIAARNRALIAANLDLLDRFFARHAGLFSWRRPAAGPIAFPRLLAGDAQRFCDELLRRTGVLLLPGSVYEAGGNHVRVGFGRADMPAALSALEEYVGSRPEALFRPVAR